MRNSARQRLDHLKERFVAIPEGTRKARRLWGCVAVLAACGTGYSGAQTLSHEAKGYDAVAYPANKETGKEAQAREFDAMTPYMFGGMATFAITGISLAGALGRRRIDAGLDWLNRIGGAEEPEIVIQTADKQYVIKGK